MPGALVSVTEPSSTCGVMLSLKPVLHNCTQRRLGVKKSGGQSVLAGNIIVRQRGTKWHPGDGVGMGKDHTLFALREGEVAYATKQKGRVYVSVKPS